MNRSYLLIIAGVCLIALGAYVALRSPAIPTLPGGNPTSSATSSTPSTNRVTEIKIALLDTTGSGTGKSRGCDTLTMVTRTIPATSAPLTAALRTLFAEKENAVPSSEYNFIARTSDTLAFDRATVEDGTANIYLTGKLSGLSGICDDPRAQIQIEETALQFSTVKRVQIFLNGTVTNLTPSQR